MFNILAKQFFTKLPAASYNNILNPVILSSLENKLDHKIPNISSSNVSVMNKVLTMHSTFFFLVSTEDLDVDVEGTDFMLGDLEWSTSSVSDSGDERSSLRSSCSDEGYASASLQRLQNTQETAKQLGCSL